MQTNKGFVCRCLEKKKKGWVCVVSKMWERFRGSCGLECLGAVDASESPCCGEGSGWGKMGGQVYLQRQLRTR